MSWRVDPDAPVRPEPEAAPADDGPWLVGGRAVWALVGGLLVVLAGALLGRPEVALLGAGPVLGAVWTLTVRPRGPVWADTVHEPAEGGTLIARLELVAPLGTDAVRVRAGRRGHGVVDALVSVPLRRTLHVRAASVRTGPQELVAVDVQGLAAGGQLTGPVGRAPAPVVTVLPRAAAMPALPLPPRLRGLTGQHGSRRPGHGGELRDVHPFQPGDSLRRVDWRATARRSPQAEQLWTRRTFADAEALVTLVVDSRDDVGPDPATWSGTRLIRPDDATSLDLARHAAATVAQGYLGAGDRVGMEDLGVRARTVRPGGGRRQLDRLLHRLAVLRPQGDPSPRLRPPQLPSGTLVWLFSTVLDDEPAALARSWRHTGHRVVLVDVLPPVRRGGMTARERLALRIVEMERADRLAQVRAAGVDVVRWADADMSAVLQLMARQSHRRPGVGVGR